MKNWCLCSNHVNSVFCSFQTKPGIINHQTLIKKIIIYFITFCKKQFIHTKIDFIQKYLLQINTKVHDLLFHFYLHVNHQSFQKHNFMKIWIDICVSVKNHNLKCDFTIDSNHDCLFLRRTSIMMILLGTKTRILVRTRARCLIHQAELSWSTKTTRDRDCILSSIWRGRARPRKFGNVAYVIIH